MGKRQTVRSLAFLLLGLLLITAACSPIQPPAESNGAESTQKPAAGTADTTTPEEQARQPAAAFDYLAPGYLPEGYSLQ